METAPVAFPTVHLLMVHGVGGHDHLSNLLRTYQSFRANLTSVEAPVVGEDLIPAWRLTQFDEGASPPVLTLAREVEALAGAVGAVRMYEVNYSGLAGVIRRNHRIDLTNLFLGLDLAVCAARQRRRRMPGHVGDRPSELGRALQRVAGVLAAGTVPIIGLPAIVFRDYIGTFVAVFTRFFEDVATFVLDKNGEQLISAHLDLTIETIAHEMKPDDRLVIAAHSLGSVVVHNYVVRRWTAEKSTIPDTLVTFGSPIGLLTWIWLFLDFENMDFAQRISERYFCWNPVSSGEAQRKKVLWINVVNCLDPIATAFTEETVDLSAPEAAIKAALDGEHVGHRFFGSANIGSVGASHTEYLNDKTGFVRLLLRASGLAGGKLEQVASNRSPAEHWAATQSVLRRLQWLIALVAACAVVAYCGLVAYSFGDRRAVWFAALFAWPGATIGVLAFFQRLLLGGPTKRVTLSLIRSMTWNDVVAFPYRLRDLVVGGAEGVESPRIAERSAGGRFLLRVVSFLPTLVAMAIPIIGAAWLTNRWPTPGELWNDAWSVKTLLGLACFMVYVVCCAVHELVVTWRRVIRLAT